MSVTISADKYPALSASAAGISGKRQVIYINYGTSATADSPVWTLLGGLTSNSLTISADVATAQTKSTGYWASGSVTSKQMELSAEVIMLAENEAQLAIEKFLLDNDITAAKKALQVAVVDLDSTNYLKLWIIPSSWEISASSDDMITKSLTATVVGAPVEATGFTVS